MRFMNVPCAYCGKAFNQEDDVVVCPHCGTPHHRECWNEHAQCANADKHAEGFVWVSPVSPQTDVKKEQTRPHAAQVNGNNAVPTAECPFCGASNYINELYCTVCHEPIHQNASADAGDPLQDEVQRDKMYSDFRTYGGLDPQSSVGDITVAEYSAYVGEKSGSYIRKFTSLHTFKRPFAWNSAAFLSSAVAMLSSICLGPVWFFYRKLNKIGVLFLCVLLAFGIADTLICASDPAFWVMMDRFQELYADFLALSQQVGADSVQLVEDMTVNMQNALQVYSETANRLTQIWAYITDVVVAYVIPLVSGFTATGLYFKKAKSDILSVREKHGNAPDYLQRIKEKGGVSVGAAAGGAVACFFVCVFPMYLPFLLRALGVF